MTSHPVAPPHREHASALKRVGDFLVEEAIRVCGETEESQTGRCASKGEPPAKKSAGVYRHRIIVDEEKRQASALSCVAYHSGGERERRPPAG